LSTTEEVDVEIVSSGKRTSRKGEAEYFTGNVWVDEIAVGAEPSRVRLFRVSFEPGARTAWHTHPVGQVLHVINPGDTVMIEPGARHWHGAAAGNTMVHLAMQEADAKGVTAVWMEKVTDAEFGENRE
jgi:quercetin dioxygenase-like cupin family protein